MCEFCPQIGSGVTCSVCGHEDKPQACHYFDRERRDWCCRTCGKVTDFCECEPSQAAPVDSAAMGGK